MAGTANASSVTDGSPCSARGSITDGRRKPTARLEDGTGSAVTERDGRYGRLNSSEGPAVPKTVSGPAETAVSAAKRGTAGEAGVAAKPSVRPRRVAP